MAEDAAESDDPAVRERHEREDAEQREAEQIAATAPRRGQRQVYEKAARTRLKSKGFFSVGAPAAAIKVTLAGGSLTGTHGDAIWIGEAISRLGRLVAALGDAAPQLAGLVFGSSVTFEFEPSEDEIARATKSLEAAQQAEDQTDDKAEALYLRAIPATAVGADMAVEFLRDANADPVETALAYGTAVTQYYSSLAAHLAAEDEVEMELRAATRRDVARLDSGAARRVRAQLRELGERRPTTIRAVGVLSLADAEKRRFGLRLDREAARHPLLKGKSVVNGEYEPAVGDALRDRGLWNKDVRATLSVEYDPRGGTSAVRPAHFKLTAVRPRFES